MQPFPYPSDATHKIWSRLANWIQRYSSLKVWTTTDDDDDDGRRTTTDGGPLVYYKLTLWAFGSGELKTKGQFMGCTSCTIVSVKGNRSHFLETMEVGFGKVFPQTNILDKHPQNPEAPVSLYLENAIYQFSKELRIF